MTMKIKDFQVCQNSRTAFCHMNKKGWIRIVEASIAILIIIGFVLTYTAKREVAVSDLTSVITPILEEIADNNNLRNDILNFNCDNLVDVVRKGINNPSLEFKIRICDISDVCGFDGTGCGYSGSFPSNDVYAVERVISATPTQEEFMPKKVKIFLWRKG